MRYPVELDLFGEEEKQHSSVVNVASVPKRSPFRYAGGKTWLIPTIRKWLPIDSQAELIEPFCGGGIVGLTVAAEKRANSVTMVELDKDVASVWETIMYNNEWLAERILNFEMSVENVNAVVLNKPADTNEHGFQTILRNRTNHGGILAKGAGVIKNGEKGKGISSRWYPATLARRIRDISIYKQRIKFVHGNAFDFINQEHDLPNTFFFIDPPYTIAGKRLYALADVDHEEIFRRVSKLKCKYLMTYDKSDYIIGLVKKYGLNWRTIPMQTTHLIQKEEILISDNFDWLA